MQFENQRKHVLLAIFEVVFKKKKKSSSRCFILNQADKISLNWVAEYQLSNSDP